MGGKASCNPVLRAGRVQSHLLVRPTPNPGSPPRPEDLCKTFLWRKRLFVFHDAVRGPGQFGGKCALGAHGVGPALFAVVPGPRLGRMHPGERGRLGKSPGKVLVAVFLVSLALGLAVGGPPARDMAAVGNVVARACETGDGSGLQHDGQAQDAAHARDAEQGSVLVCQFHPFFGRFFDEQDAPRDPVLAEPLDVARGNLAAVAGEDVLQAQDERGAEADQVAPFA